MIIILDKKKMIIFFHLEKLSIKQTQLSYIGVNIYKELPNNFKDLNSKSFGYALIEVVHKFIIRINQNKSVEQIRNFAK